ncbi:MYND-type domain-containing protein [Mycena kentingensis (nom. inval.)]|nr:MYND-type domain-containing protein [Mycena kentingensis (nom. inval.)]
MLHHLLRPERIERLPFHDRMVAKRALRPTRTAAIVLEAAKACGRAPLEEQLHYLPVFYDILDPARIPPATQVLDTIAGAPYEEVEILLRAYYSVLGIIGKRKEMRKPDLLSAVWARVWPYIQFAFDFFDVHPAFTAVAYSRLRSVLNFLGFVTVYLSDAESHNVVLSTPGFARILGEASTLLNLRDMTLQVSSEGVPNLTQGLWRHFRGVLEHGTLDELIEGAGGTVALAAVISAQVELMAKIPAVNPFDLSHYLNFVEVVDGSDQHTTLTPPGPLARAVYRASAVVHIIEVVGDLLGWLADSAEDHDEDHVNIIGDEVAAIFDFLLGHFLFVPEEYRSYNEEIGGRLFRALWLAVAFVGEDGIQQTSTHLVRAIMPALLLDYRALRLFAPELERFNVRVATGAPVSEEWKDFLSVAEERLELLRDWVPRTNEKNCDNLECVNTARKQCSQCKDAYYCSKQCQRIDWRTGKHREVCAMMPSFGVNRIILGSRQRCFILAILDHDYQMHKQDIQSEKAKILARHPDATCITMFNYASDSTSLHVRVTVLDFDLGCLQDEETLALWTRAVERARAGKYTLHLVDLPRHLAFPHRRVLLQHRSIREEGGIVREFHQ